MGPNLNDYMYSFVGLTLRKRATIQQVTTMLATSKNVLFSDHNDLLTTSTDDLTLFIAQATLQVKSH